MLVGSRKWKRAIFLILFLLGACANGEGIEAHEAWVRTALKGENSAVYLILHNHTLTHDVLIYVSTDVALVAEIHLSQVDENSVMKMIPQHPIELPNNGEFELSPGGYHIMLIDLKQDLKIGDEIILTLHFRNYPDVVLNVPVQDSAEKHQYHP